MNDRMIGVCGVTGVLQSISDAGLGRGTCMMTGVVLGFDGHF
jgi:hypothetical protein